MLDDVGQRAHGRGGFTEDREPRLAFRPEVSNVILEPFARLGLHLELPPLGLPVRAASARGRAGLRCPTARWRVIHRVPAPVGPHISSWRGARCRGRSGSRYGHCAPPCCRRFSGAGTATSGLRRTLKGHALMFRVCPRREDAPMGIATHLHGNGRSIHRLTESALTWYARSASTTKGAVEPYALLEHTVRSWRPQRPRSRPNAYAPATRKPTTT